MKYYKTFRGTSPDRLTGAYGHGAYDLSRLPVTLPALEGEPLLCKYGYHVCRREHVVCHLSDYIAEVECDGVVYEGDKGATCGPLIVLRLYERWTPQVQRLFAADCAAAVLHLTTDPRRTAAVRTARLYALGRATKKDLAAARGWAAAGWAAEWAAAEAREAAAAGAAQTDLLWAWLDGRRTAADVEREMGLT